VRVSSLGFRVEDSGLGVFLGVWGFESLKPRIFRVRGSDLRAELEARGAGPGEGQGVAPRWGTVHHLRCRFGVEDFGRWV
jgi:hypothetical protein